MAVKQVELPVTERDRHDKRQQGMIAALKGEIALLKDLYHPNIVAYLGMSNMVDMKLTPGCESSLEHLSMWANTPTLR